MILGFALKIGKAIISSCFPHWCGRFYMLGGIFFNDVEILHACRESGRNSVQAGDSLSMRESWKPWKLNF